MYNYTVSLIAGFIAMACAMSSYMFSKKTTFLIYQLLAMVFLSVSYLFIEEFFAMLGMTVSVIRTIVYFVIERKNKVPKFWLKTLFGGLTLISYIIVNIVILKTAKPLDLLFMTGNIMYSYSFGFKNLKVLQMFMLLPTGVTIIYNLLAPATLFVIISYIFEFIANIVGIIKITLRERKEKIIEFKKSEEK